MRASIELGGRGAMWGAGRERRYRRANASERRYTRFGGARIEGINGREGKHERHGGTGDAGEGIWGEGIEVGEWGEMKGDRERERRYGIAERRRARGGRRARLAMGERKAMGREERI